MYHIDKNGVAVVTPDYLVHPNGTIPHPLQRSGAISHLPNFHGITDFFTGHGFFGNDRSVIKTPSQQ